MYKRQLDTQCTEYFSVARALDKENFWESLSKKSQEAYRDAILAFARRSDGLLPEHFVVYRASTNEEDWRCVKAAEIEAVIHVVLAANVRGSRRDPYEPRVTFVAIAKRVGMRFFVAAPNLQNAKNPEPGTVVDNPMLICPNTYSFYLVNQAVGNGSAVPTLYTVLYDTANLLPDVLQNLSYRLSFLYFNCPGSVRMPAPAQYAKKIAHFIGSAVQQDPHKRLLSTLFYL